ncbi:prepilin-type N-terminal cleavage/methylation domain-containing protein (plasmid) [Polaromonas sp. P1-6]|nr:prepilin-type N-terminal cleavage/methylation domain-containing protein [Polaromonas sp. P1-6]
MKSVKAIKSPMRKQGGFTILELTTVIAIIAILSILSLFALPPFVISGKVGPASNELLRGMQKMRINAEGAGMTPYATANTSTFANLMRGGSVFTVTNVGAAATLNNSMRLLGTSVVTVAPGTMPAGVLGDSYVVTAANVSDAACPELAASAQRGAERITINGVQVKAPGGNYNGVAATAACTLLDTNTYTFQAM